MSDVNQRSALEVAVIRSTMAALKRAGFKPTSVFDGEQRIKAVTPDEVLTLALNLDECNVRFTGDYWLYLVFGNDGWDVIADYGYDETEQGKKFAAAVDSIDPEGIGSRSACTLPHIWAWQNKDGAHGGCIKCGRHKGEGVKAVQMTEEVE